MQCVFCLEEMNAEATVCKTCARQQPLTTDQKQSRIGTIVLVVIGVLVVVAIGYFVIDGIERNAAVGRIVDCLHSKGNSDATASSVNYELDDAMKQTGKGWRESLAHAAIQDMAYFPTNPQWGGCYINSDNLISEMKGD